jgi:hypothetical protein
MKLAEDANLTETPELVTWPETHYVFVERVGPFMENAGAAWQQAHPLVKLPATWLSTRWARRSIARAFRSLRLQ